MLVHPSIQHRKTGSPEAELPALFKVVSGSGCVKTGLASWKPGRRGLGGVPEDSEFHVGAASRREVEDTISQLGARACPGGTIENSPPFPTVGAGRRAANRGWKPLPRRGGLGARRSLCLVAKARQRGAAISRQERRQLLAKRRRLKKIGISRANLKSDTANSSRGGPSSTIRSGSQVPKSSARAA
jgi:hypothetical protein